MKVKVRRVSLYGRVNELLSSPEGKAALQALWPGTVCRLSTATLQRMVRWHAHGRLDNMAIEELMFILEELARRREASGPPTPFRSNEEAWADFVANYMPKVTYDPRKPHELLPSPQGRDCLGNGSWPGYECQCDECGHYLVCFPKFDQ